MSYILLCTHFYIINCRFELHVEYILCVIIGTKSNSVYRSQGRSPHTIPYLISVLSVFSEIKRAEERRVVTFFPYVFILCKEPIKLGYNLQFKSREICESRRLLSPGSRFYVCFSYVWCANKDRVHNILRENAGE